MKWLIFAFVCLACRLALAAEPRHLNTELPPDETEVHLVAEGLPSPTSGDVTSLGPRQVLKTFLRTHPNYVIEPFLMPAVGGTSLDSGPLMAIAAGMPPHVMYVNFRKTSTYVEQGFLEPLEVLLARTFNPDPATRQHDGKHWKADPSPEQVAEAVEIMHRRVPASVWKVIYRPAEAAGDGIPHVWGVPYSYQVSALTYRKDLFLESGLDPERAPKNWDEFLDYARRITDPKKQRYGVMFRGSGEYISWAIYEILASAGAEAMREDEHGQWKAAYGNREAAEAVYLVWRMLHEPFTTADGQQARACAFLETGTDRLRWTQGKVGMQFGPISEELISTADPVLFGIAPIPASPRGTSAGQINALMNGVFSGCTPAQKLAAMSYIWFVSSTEAKRIRTQIYVENGFGQFVSPDLLREFGYERQLRLVSKGWQETFTQAMQGGVPEPYGRNTQNIFRWMSEPINSALDDPKTLAGLDREAALARIQSLMQASAERVNREVLSPPSPATMSYRRAVAIPVIFVVALSFLVALKRVWRSFSNVDQPGSATIGSRRRRWRRFAVGYALLVPAAVLMIIWAYAPLGMGLSISLLDYRLVRPSEWAGLDNFANILFDADRFWKPLWRTFYFVALTIGLGFWPPILLAILLQEIPTATAKYIFRTIYYLPAVVSGLVVIFLWRQLYDPTEFGVLNQLLLSLNGLNPIVATLIKLLLLAGWLSFVGILLWTPVKLYELSRVTKVALFTVGLAMLAITLGALFGDGGAGTNLASLVGGFHIQPLRWTADPSLAMLCVVLPHVWAASGPGCILYLAALKSIPDELYEAADIDAAGPWHKVFYIVVPSLKYILIVQFVGAVTGAFRGGVEMIMVMTGGGPNNSTSILALEMFYRVFFDLQFGIGTAMAWVLGALLIGFTAYQLKMLARAEVRAGG